MSCHTNIFEACDYGCFNCIKLYINDIDKQNISTFDTPLFLLVKYGHYKCLYFALKYISKNPQFYNALYKKTKYTNTLLHIAYTFDIIKILLQYGCVHIKNKDNENR